MGRVCEATLTSDGGGEAKREDALVVSVYVKRKPILVDATARRTELTKILVRRFLCILVVPT